MIHLEATHHLERRVGGWYDSGLTDLGRVQARASRTGFAAFRSVSGGLTVLGEDDRFHDRAVLVLSDISHLSSVEHRDE